MNFIPPFDETRLRAAASGVLPNGKPVVVNADGTVSVIEAATQAIGSEVEFESGAVRAEITASVFDPDSNKVIIAYCDTDNSNYGTAVVGTVSGTSISFGTPAVFESGHTSNIGATYDTANDKVIIVYKDEDNSNHGTAVVGTVSGTAISFGTAAVYLAASSNFNHACFDTNAGKAVITFRNDSNSDATARVGTVNGTDITFGTAVQVDDNGNYVRTVFDSNSNKVVVAYRDGATSNYGRARVGTVSGTDISFGDEETFSSSATEDIDVAFDTASNKVIIAYKDGGDSDKGKAVVGTVSNTDISFGSAATFNSSAVTSVQVIYHSAGDILGFFWTDSGEIGEFNTGKVSGTSIGSFSTKATYHNARTSVPTVVYDASSTNVVTAFRDVGDSNKGNSVVVQLSFTNLTAENYIGMSGGAVSYGASSSQVLGSRQVFAAAGTFFSSMAYDPDRQRIIIAYMDSGNSSFATAITGTVSGSSITYAAEAALTNFDVNATAIAYDTNSDKAVIFYADDAGGTTPVKCRVTTIAADGTLSFGTEVTVANTGSALSATFDSNSNKVIIAYSASSGKARVGTVSGTDISFGTEVTFEAGTTTDIDTTFDSTNNKVVIAYKDQGNSNFGTAIVGTVSGTDISFGTAVVFHSASTLTITLAFDSNVGKVLVSYKDQGNEANGNARVGTVSGTGISFGTEAIYFTETDGGPAHAASVFDSTANKVIIFASSSSYGGTVIAGTINGTTVSFNTQAVFTASGASDSNTRFFGAAYDSNAQRSVLAYTDGLNSSNGTSVVYCPDFDNTVRGQVASGSSASVDIIGTVNEQQTGLTAGQQYFVQTDGTIGLTADDPSVFAGTAISATELVVKA